MTLFSISGFIVKPFDISNGWHDFAVLKGRRCSSVPVFEDMACSVFLYGAVVGALAKSVGGAVD